MFSQGFLSSPAGIASLDYANEIYSSLFKCGEFTLAQYPEMLDELVQFHMQPVYSPTPLTSHFSHTFSSDEDEEDDSVCICDDLDPVIISPGLSFEQAHSLALSSTYVWLCNYKGEGEGFDLKEKTESLSTFHSKWDYSK